MANSFSTLVRTDNVQNVITRAGASAKWKFYNGTQPATAGTALSGNTLLGFVTSPTVIGTAASGVLDIDEAGITQVNTAHVAGTATFVDLTTSADVVVARLTLGGAGNLAISGPIVNGQNINFTAPVTITAGA